VEKTIFGILSQDGGGWIYLLASLSYPFPSLLPELGSSELLK